MDEEEHSIAAIDFQKASCVSAIVSDWALLPELSAAGLQAGRAVCQIAAGLVMRALLRNMQTDGGPPVWLYPVVVGLLVTSEVPDGPCEGMFARRSSRLAERCARSRLAS